MENRLSVLLLCAMLLLSGCGQPAWAKIVRNVRVTAYHSHRITSGGHRPQAWTCAGPGRWHGYYLQIPGVGWRRVTDTCRHGVDIWLPSVQACKRWGRRMLTIRVEVRKG